MKIVITHQFSDEERELIARWHFKPTGRRLATRQQCKDFINFAIADQFDIVMQEIDDEERSKRHAAENEANER